MSNQTGNRPTPQPRPQQPQQHPQPEKGQPMLLRCVALVVVFVLAGALLGVKLSQLQISEASEWAAMASRQQLASITLTPMRGNIYDSNMKLLAQSATVWTVEASPDVLNSYTPKNTDEDDEGITAARLASRELARILELDEEKLYENLSNKDKKYYRIKAKIEKPAADAIRELCNLHLLYGITLTEDTKRYYPYEDLASTVLGFVGGDNQGLEGLERWYDETLAGVPGRTMTLIDARGQEIAAGGEGVSYAAEDGRSIVLTLNTDIQSIVEKYLAMAVEKYQPKQRAFAIVMDVNTGAILALAVSPSYNSNEPYTIYDVLTQDMLKLLPEGSDQYTQLQGEARTLQWRNKALADTYEPGSVMKIITAAAALDSGTYTQDSCFVCGRSIMVGDWDKPISCAGDPPTDHGTPTLRQALIDSCNVSFIRMSAGMGKSVWYDYLRAFGLTEPTGIDLPGEPSQQAINNLIYSEARMGPVELASASFGQSHKYTAVQMITAVSAAVNGGNLMQPYIVDKELDVYGNVVSQHTPVVKRQVISPETSAQMRDILEELVISSSGRPAYVAGYRVGGKSGTSQKLELLAIDEENKQYISSFLGFAPADNPEIAVLLALDEPEDLVYGNYFGARLAGPYVGEIIRESLQVLGVEPNYVSSADQARETISTPKTVDNEITDAKVLLNKAGLNHYVVGNGSTVIGQMPQAYSQIPAGGEVVLYTDPAIPQERVTMPDVMGKTAADAIQLLRSAGLNVTTKGAPDDASSVRVGAQSVMAGEAVPRGTVIMLTMEDTTNVVDY